MSETKFTKGEWKIEYPHHCKDDPTDLFALSIRPDGYFRGDICHMQSCEHIQGITKAELLANAALIQSAPEMYEALEMAYEILTERVPALHTEYPAFLAKIRLALTKAEWK